MTDERLTELVTKTGRSPSRFGHHRSLTAGCYADRLPCCAVARGIVTIR
jgi:hypothetical protein